MLTALNTLSAQILVRWTVRLAVGCYLVRVLRDLRFGRRAGPGWSVDGARIAWTVGCICLWIHVAAVFHYHHQWSHAAAYRHTALETTHVTGMDIGGIGLYINYLFLAWWTADAALWWIKGGRWLNQHPCYFAALHAIFAFIMFNATVVFGPAGWIPVAIVFLILGTGALSLRVRRRAMEGGTPVSSTSH